MVGVLSIQIFILFRIVISEKRANSSACEGRSGFSVWDRQILRDFEDIVGNRGTGLSMYLHSLGPCSLQ